MPIHAKRNLVNAVLYLGNTGAQWKVLPKSFPPWKTEYDHDSNGNRRGVSEAAIDELHTIYRKRPQSRYAQLRDHRFTRR